jgi:hypothetical protein
LRSPPTRPRVARTSWTSAAACTLERCHPILLIEHSGDFEAIQKLLEARGYSAYGYQAGVGRFAPFTALSAGPNVFFMRPEAIPRDA